MLERMSENVMNDSELLSLAQHKSIHQRLEGSIRLWSVVDRMEI